ncbi:glycerate 2-kinase [Halovenus aranensis]|uniref:Glycerate 2-kinase n=1 Tax=Halovenus aranensis TaxID=890420 RepID=A0A1G8XSK0_9EURY|nr:DUF4147 domain-containing protein [Halovenus aranensis]SDJ93164.1 glycerate 2-kinase [Halovenus aranensis]
MIRNRDALARTPTHGVALDAIEAGIEAAHPETVVTETVSLSGDTLSIADERYDLDSFERVLVLGGGKPAGAVAAALEAVLGERIDGGAVVTATPVETNRVTVHEGTHPLPSEANVRATSDVLDRARRADEDTLVLAVITGGASALLSAPAEGVTIEDLCAVTDGLLDAGATIAELNAVRKHLSRLKGGQLARELAPAMTVGVVFSDVVGNPLAVVASGPTAPDSSTYAEAVAVLDRYDIDPPAAVCERLGAGTAGDRPETPDPDSAVFDGVDNHVLADGQTAVDAAAAVCADAGYEPVVLSTRVEGEAREAGRRQAAIARECLVTDDPVAPPVGLLSGGETTVTVTGDGDGGPNQEFALAAGCNLDETAGRVVVGSVDTDGVDGASEAAGALVEETVGGQAAREALADNDSETFLRGQDRLIETGPTGTNVNDLRVLLVGE